MKTPTCRVVLSALAVLLLSTAAFAQGSATSSITGVVVDASGGAIPGADVVVRNTGTGATFTAVTSDQGSFTIPALNTGTYTVTVSIMGFKTRVLNDVVLTGGSPANVRAELEVGGIDETVTVSAGAEVIETSSSTVSTTLNVNQVSNLPLVSRNAIDFITFLPGVSTPGGNRDSTVNGLPQSAINITVDGMNVQDNHLKTTDGFFARMSPRLDAVEEVTVTMAAQGADAASQGAVQIRFVTRSGSNDFTGSAYHYFRHHSLNANTWFNNRDGLDKPELVQNQPGGRIGGPIVIPGLWDGRDRAFFFINYEEFRQPTDVRRNRDILHPLAQQGIFRYETSGGVREVDLLALAASRGQTATLDPTIAKLLADMRATTSEGTVTDLTDPNLQRFSFLTPQRSHNRYPTGRLDLNLSSAHRLSGSFNYQHINSNPDTLNNRDPRFPGFPSTGTQDSHRYTTKTSLRSTIGSSIVNEFSVGATGGPTYFSNELNPGMWGGTSIGDQGGFHLDIDTAKIDNASNGPTVQWREASTKVVENTVNWIKGSHSLSFGGSWTQVDLALFNQTLVPELDFDIISGDPAASLFTTANFPGASNTALADAGDLYAVLTGRVSGISGDARIDENTGEFVFLGPSIQRGRMRETDFFVQDAWRVRPNLTVNAGLRYVLQFPFYPLNNSYSTATLADLCGVSGTNPDTVCNLFQPGNLPGKVPEFINFGEGTHAYETDWNNWAPSLGFAWVLGDRSGVLGTLLGDEAVIRGGFAVAYSRNGTSDFSGVYGSNPGVAISANRNLSLDNLGTPPILFRNRDLLGPPEIPRALEYPFRDDVTGDLEMFDPNLQVPYARTWTAGIQRAITRNMAIEARYVGTQSGDQWQEMEFNEINIVENGFLDEFRAAQANLQANVAAGRGSTFRYFGPDTGTMPLPIFLAYFSGVSTAQAGNAALYTSSLFRNSDFVNPLALFNPNPFGAASELFDSGSRRSNALRAGLPANFFVVNPHQLGGAELTTNEGRSRHHSMQLELRRRLANGFQFQSSYVLGRTRQSNFFSFRRPRLFRRDTGSEGETSHAFKANVVYELPFGRGRRFGSNVGGLVDRLIGGWSVAGTARIQSGRLVNLGNTRLVGMTADEAGDLFRLRFDDTGRVFMLPQDVIDETVKAFSVSATSPTGYGPEGPPSGRYFAPANGPDCIELAGGFGDCGIGELIVTGPMFQNYDISVTKRVPIVGRVNAEFRVELLNAFNNVNFVPVGGIGNDPDDYEVTGLTGTPTSRIAQIVSRITW